MVSSKELFSRLKWHFRFSRQEVMGMLAAVIIFAFILSFRDWGGEKVDILIGLKNLATALLIAALGLTFRLSCQKIYALAEGYQAEFKIWWIGLVIAVVVAFVSQGRLPLLIAGAMIPSFMTRQRLGEFRYGFSYWHNGMIAYWGILGNLIMGILMAVGLYFFPQSYFFHQGLLFNWVMGVFALIPIPYLDGLSIFFASRMLYVMAAGVVALAGLLLLTGTKLGLLLAIVIGGVYALVYLLIGSEK